MFPINNAFNGATPTLGTVIRAGEYPQAIGSDPSSKIWVAGITVTDIASTSAVYVITKPDAVHTVATVTGLTYAALAGTLSGTLCFAKCLFTRQIDWLSDQFCPSLDWIHYHFVKHRWYAIWTPVHHGINR